MNAMFKPAPDAGVRPPTRRALAKRETREKIVAAARALFIERGYEGATIREIASAAGMSTGAVFASFADKAELFAEIVANDDRDHLVAMRAAAAEAKGADALLAAFRAGYAFHLAQLPLLQAAVSVAWLTEEAARERARSFQRPVVELISGVVQAAKDSGELPARTDVSLVSDMLWDAYAANYRALLNRGLDLDGLTAFAKRQIAVILAGAGASAAA